MRWKSVALAGALGPAALGCNIYRNAARNIINEPLVVATKLGIEHELRSEARATWRRVRAEYPRRAFTAEFRDGFEDGYVDYLDRGGNGSLPAVPPSKYTRHKKYYTEQGQCLVKDYFLGFKYGQEIAIATGKRQFLTVPVLLPVTPDGPPAFTIQPPGGAAPVPPMPVPTPPVLPQPNPVGSSVPAPPPSKFPTPVSTGNPDAAAPSPAGTTVLESPAPAAPAAPPAPVPPVQEPRLPAPPPEVPELPSNVPTPSPLDELPVVPPTHTVPAAVPPTHPEALGK